MFMVYRLLFILLLIDILFGLRSASPGGSRQGARDRGFEGGPGPLGLAFAVRGRPLTKGRAEGSLSLSLSLALSLDSFCVILPVRTRRVGVGAENSPLKLK